MAPKRKNTKAKTPTKRLSDTTKKPKKALIAIDEIYEACFVTPKSWVERRTAYSENNTNVVSIWNWMIGQKEEEQEDSNTTATYKKACQLVTVLTSYEHQSGRTVTQALEGLLLLLKQQTTDDVWHAKVVTHWIETSIAACSPHPSTAQEWEYWAAVVHVVDLLINAQSEWTCSYCDTLGLGVEMWNYLPARQRDLLLKQQQQQQQQQGVERAVGQGRPVPLMVQVIRQFLRLVQGETFALGTIRFERTNPDEEDDDDNENTGQDQERLLQQWIFVHRALELLIDALAYPTTRLYVAPYLVAVHLVHHARVSVGTASPTSYLQVDENLFLAQQLLQRLDRWLQFPSAQFSSHQQQVELYHSRATVLQKMCHRHFPMLKELIFAGVGVLCTDRTFVRNSLGGLSDAQLVDLLHKMRLMDASANNNGTDQYNRDFLLAVLEHFVLLPPNPMDQLATTPLYPTETVLWNFARIPPSMASLLPASQVLSLPKLQTQFLSFTDYLCRNFELMQLESAYEVRSDLVDVIRRVRPLLRQTVQIDDNGNEVTELKTELTGWARMALELDGVELMQVQKPLLGEKYPSQVVAELKLDLAKCGDSIRREWDELGEFDNLFLVAIDASKMSGQQAPLLSEYHQRTWSHSRWDTDKDRRIPDEEDRTFPERYGVTLVRGCMILSVRDVEGTIVGEGGGAAMSGTKRSYRVALDPMQYSQDTKSSQGSDMYNTLNLVVRRHGKENNFKAMLETIRGLMVGTGAMGRVLPSWIQPLLLGCGEPDSAHYKSMALQTYARSTAGVSKPGDYLDFGDTFVDVEHLRRSFPKAKVEFPKGKNESMAKGADRQHYRLRTKEVGTEEVVEVLPYNYSGPAKGNTIPFTPLQVEAIRSGLSPGLTVVVGPPGTGKTDVACQIIACLYHSFPTQRTVVITHSNAALNDIFQKVTARGDVDERYLVRLGAGERNLQIDSTHDFTKAGRVAYSLQRRGKLLEEVQQISESLGFSGRAERGPDGSPSYTCETATYFYENHVQKRVRAFESRIKDHDDGVLPSEDFPFSGYFKLDGLVDVKLATECIDKVRVVFRELAEYRPLELLRTQRQRSDYLLMKQARLVAMTCTHAAIARSHLISLGFEYDNIIVEEAGQMTEIENFIPLLLQRGSHMDSTSARLKRICLMGDHNQLPPVIKNMSFAHYSNLDQSMFARLIRLGVQHLQLDKQGRARPEIADLYSWRYENLGNLDHVSTAARFQTANPGFAHTVQVINVDKFQGKGERTPTAFFYQNLGEAEYAIALFQYMVLIGYSPLSISILTTYNGQRALLEDVLTQRCGDGTPLDGVRPRSISTVDQYQGQQNDYILLSLVRTESVGHVRDVRRLVVAMSRARLGLYILCHHELFANCHELKRTFDQLAVRPNKLQLVLDETMPTERRLDDRLDKRKVFEVEDVSHMGSLVFQMQESMVQS